MSKIRNSSLTFKYDKATRQREEQVDGTTAWVPDELVDHMEVTA